MFLHFEKLGWQKRIRQSKISCPFCFFCFAFFLHNWIFFIIVCKGWIFSPARECRNVTLWVTWKQNTSSVYLLLLVEQENAMACLWIVSRSGDVVLFKMVLHAKIATPLLKLVWNCTFVCSLSRSWGVLFPGAMQASRCDIPNFTPTKKIVHPSTVST